MKRVSIITIIDNNNFGTFLQAFALCKSIEALGHKPELVNYCRPHMRPYKAWLNMCKEVKNPLRILFRSIGYLKSSLLHNKDLSFLSDYLSKKKCYSLAQIQRYITPADVYMTGSDQVWNSIHNKGIDKAFYLDYAPDSAKKVSYAASIGMPDFQEWEKAETKRLLEPYNYITLREETSVKIIESLGIESNKIEAVLDPTLLLTMEQWRGHIKLPRLYKEKYLLVYSVETKKQDAIINEVAQCVARERGLKIVGVDYGSEYNRIQCCDYNHFRATPEVFLSLLYYADFVVVSSFHGTAFAINFEKEFYTVMPDRFNARVSNILNITHLENRLIINEKQVKESISQDIDYVSVARIISEERRKSMGILQKIIEE